MKRKRMGEILLEAGLLSEEQLIKALALRKKSKKRLGQVLVEMEFTDEEAIYKTISKQMNIPIINLGKIKIEQEILGLVPPELCHKRRLIPIGLDENFILIAMSNPLDYEAMDDVSFVTGMRIKPFIAREKEILNMLIRFHPPGEKYVDEIRTDGNLTNIVQVIQETDDLEEIDFIKLEKSAKGGVIAKLTNAIMANAIKRRASDIHIEPKEKDVLIRYRIDGIMRDTMNFGKIAQAAVISRIKIMANLDITIRREPQDGRIRIMVENEIYDLRVSSLPTLYGEKLVIRVHEIQTPKSLSQLGLAETNLKRFMDMLKKPQGLILVTGPTGSGKTTTLYAALNHLHSPEINIVTIEDPIEYSIPGITQMQVNPKTGLTFSKGLRHLLRQDPNVVMIGEIRDKETATIAFQATQTGHLVLSTLHTNDAASTIVRILDLGIEPYVVSSGLLGILAQRLLRRIHKDCSEILDVDPVILSKFPVTPLDKFRKGKGCIGCQNSGYKGRIGIFEILNVTSKIRQCMMKISVSDREILDIAREDGMTSMAEDAFQKAKLGVTTLEEIMKTAPPSDKIPIGPQSVASDVQLDQQPTPSETDKGIRSDGQVLLERKSSKPILSESLSLDSGIRLDRILVVDDDEAIRMYLKKILEAELFEVILAVDGEDAIKKVFTTQPDLIIIDYMMPKMNGIELIKKLQIHSRISAIPTIMLTASEEEKSEVQALDAGADDWIRKPINAPRLLARIKRVLRLKAK